MVERRQLLALGWTRRAIERRLASGELHEIHRGVYAVGHRRLTRRGRWMAAVLAAGPGAVLSHRAAAALWGLRRSKALEVTTVRRCRREGILTHRAKLPSDEVTVLDGIPATTVARTLLDLATVLPRDQVRHALEEAEYQRLTDLAPLDALAARYPRQRGVVSVRAPLADARLGLDISREQLERDFLAFLDAENLPRPYRNYIVEGYTCDIVYPEHRLIIELDGGAHRTRKRFESDRPRDRKLTLDGWRVIRVTWRHLHHGRNELANDLAYAMNTGVPALTRR